MAFYAGRNLCDTKIDIERFSFECSKVFGTCIAFTTPPDWFKKRARLFSSNYRSQTKTKQDSLARVFPALCVSYMCLIGSLEWLCSLGLARMITLVLEL